MPPDPAKIDIRARFVTMLPTGERIEVAQHGVGYGFEVQNEAEDRLFGGFDSRWTADAAYEAAVNGARNRRKRR